jgi:hypothetical protein
MLKINEIKKCLTTENDEDFEILAASNDIVFWVDWRENDENIIEYCENIIKTEKLTASVNDVDDEIGFEIIINYKDVKTKIPYKGKGSDRDTTIITLNEILKPDFEIRFCKFSDNSDTLAFLPLIHAQWIELEKEFGKQRVSKHFVEISKDSVLFG